jgi:hypothetical protein
MAVTMDERARREIARRRRRGRDATLLVRVGRIGVQEYVAVGWASRQRGVDEVVRLVDGVVVLMDERVAAYTREHAITISAWRWGPFAQVVVVRLRPPRRRIAGRLPRTVRIVVCGIGVVERAARVTRPTPAVPTRRVVGRPDAREARPQSLLAVGEEILRDLDAFVRARVRVGQQQLDHGAVLGAAQDQADRVGLALGVVVLARPGQVELHLRDVGRRDLADLQVDQDRRPQEAVVENEIDIIVLVADGQAHLPAHEAEAMAQFEEEAFDVGHERRF